MMSNYVTRFGDILLSADLQQCEINYNGHARRLSVFPICQSSRKSSDPSDLIGRKQLHVDPTVK